MVRDISAASAASAASATIALAAVVAQKEITDIKVSIARIEEIIKMDSISKIDHRKLIDNIDLRVTNVEKWQWKAVGWASACAAIISFILQEVLKKFLTP